MAATPLSKYLCCERVVCQVLKINQFKWDSIVPFKLKPCIGDLLYLGDEMRFLWPLRLCTFWPQICLPITLLPITSPLALCVLPTPATLNSSQTERAMFFHFSKILHIQVSIWNSLSHISHLSVECLLNSVIPDAKVILLGRILMSWLPPCLCFYRLLLMVLYCI